MSFTADASASGWRRVRRLQPIVVPCPCPTDYFTLGDSERVPQIARNLMIPNMAQIYD
jgi:hypothetical protein